MKLEEAIEHAKANLGDGATVKIYVERGFAYAFCRRADGSVFNPDMRERLPLSEQVRIATEVGRERAKA